MTKNSMRSACRVRFAPIRRVTAQVLLFELCVRINPVKQVEMVFVAA